MTVARQRLLIVKKILTVSFSKRNMRLKVLIFFLFLHRKVFGGEDSVVQYTDEEFDSKMGSHDTALVMFYAPWCGHCKSLKPEYAKAAVDLASNDPAVSLVKVDCTESGKATCEKYGIDGYPTLKIFRNGKFSENYKGPRTSEGIVSFMKQKVGPKFKRLESAEEVEDFTKGGGGKEVRVVGYFDGENAFKENFFKVAEELWEKVKFGFRVEEGVDERVVLVRPPQMRNKFEEDQVVFSGDKNVEEMKEFIKKNFHGLVGIRNSGNAEEFKMPLVVAYYDVNFESNPKVTGYWRNRMLKVAKNFKDRITFAISNKDDFMDELNEYGYESSDFAKPVVYAFNTGKKKYVMEDPFSCENLTKFVEHFLDGKLEPKVKSEPVPLVNDGPVKVAVAKNFDQVVRDNGKDTLLAFYAPWNSQCKKLAKSYEELAKKLKDEVEFVKMDATANDVPSEFQVDSYPTVYWLSKEKKNEPILYKGKKKYEDIIKFIAEHSTDGLKDFDRDGNSKKVIPEKTEL